MKVGYVISRKPTRDERICVIGMAGANININYVPRHFDIHKTTAYRTVNRFLHKCWLETTRNRKDRNKIKSTGGTFHSYHIKAKIFLSAHPLC